MNMCSSKGEENTYGKLTVGRIVNVYNSLAGQANRSAWCHVKRISLTSHMVFDITRGDQRSPYEGQLIRA